MDDKRFALLLLVALIAAVVLLTVTAPGAMAAELSRAAGSDDRAAWRAASGATIAGLGLFGLLGGRRG